MIMCGSQTLKQEAVILMLFCIRQDFEILVLCETCSGKLSLGIKPVKEKEL